jgi:hypothetical protein
MATEVVGANGAEQSARSAWPTRRPADAVAHFGGAAATCIEACPVHVGRRVLRPPGGAPPGAGRRVSVALDGLRVNKGRVKVPAHLRGNGDRGTAVGVEVLVY